MSQHKIGVMSDTHLCSKSERLDLLEQSFNVLKSEGITDVYHAGDLLDGHGVYKGQEFQLKRIGADEQVDYVIKHFPHRKGITTHFISGNHDLSFWDKEGIDVGRSIAERREDMKHLGHYCGRVNLSGVWMDLVHGRGGYAYAASYPLQRFINELEGGSKPHILVMGHFHRTLYMVYRNIHALLPGAFQDQNDYTRRKGLQPNKGFWTLEFKVDNGVKAMEPVWYPYYNRRQGRRVYA